MKYLVLGSAGQVGQALVRFLLKNNEEVITFDIQDDLKQDLRNKGAVDKLIEDADFVYFLAFDVGGSRYLNRYQNTYNFLHNNTLLHANTFELLNKYKKPFIYSSSQMSNMVFSPYGLSKKMGELYSVALGGLIVKFWNVYGMENEEEKFHVITDFILSARRQGKIKMMTDGLEERQFLHVDDCSKCLYTLSKKYNELPRDKELHVTSFKWSTIKEVANIVSKRFNIDEIISGKQTDIVQNNNRNEPDKFILEYWKPLISLDAGINQIIEEMNL